MRNYEYNLIIIFQKNGKYMFEFGIEEITKLFIENPGIPPDKRSIEKDRIFKIGEVCYKVESLAFDFFIQNPPVKTFDARLIVSIILLPDNNKVCIEQAVIIPEEIIKKNF